MARINNLENFLSDVATAIKTKLNDETSIPASQFDTKIMSIETVGTYENKTLTISTNGTQTIVPTSGYDAIESLVLTVQVPIKQLQTKSYEFTQNTNIVLQPETGYDGFSSVSLQINVPSATINNQNKTITENGSYTADQGYTGIGTATVNVPITGTSEYDSDLLLSQQILGGSALPYTELEYIESTGTQYIDTGMDISAGNTRVKSKFLLTSVGTNYYNILFGTQNVAGTTSMYLRYDKDTGGFEFKGGTTTSHTISVNTIYEVDYTETSNNVTFILNNNIITNTSVSYSNFSQYNIWLFQMNDSGSIGSTHTGLIRLYNFKLYSNGVLVRDFMPVIRKSDNEICLYDKVTNAFFTNQGTGSFVAGPVIS